MNSIFTEIELLSSLTLKTKEVLKTNIIFLQWQWAALATDLLSYFSQPCIVLWRRNKIIRQISRAWSLRGGGRVEDGFFHLSDNVCSKNQSTTLFFDCLEMLTISIQRGAH